MTKQELLKETFNKYLIEAGASQEDIEAVIDSLPTMEFIAQRYIRQQQQYEQYLHERDISSRSESTKKIH